MSSSNEQTGIERKLPDDDNESKPNIQSGTAVGQPSVSSSQTNPTDTEQQFEVLLNKLKNSKTNPSTTDAYKETKQEVLAILKASPTLKETFMAKWKELRQQRSQQQQQQQSQSPPINQYQLSQTSRQPDLSTKVNDPTPNIPPSQVSGVQPSQSTPTQALQQLFTTLRNTNNNPQAQQQVLAILKSQPALMATFIKQRQEQQKQQQLEQKLVQQVEPVQEDFFPEGPVDQSTPQGSVVAQPQAPGTKIQKTQKNLDLLNQNNSNNPETREEVMNILKSMPDVMATFIKEQREKEEKRLQQKPKQKDLKKK